MFDSPLMKPTRVRVVAPLAALAVAVFVSACGGGEAPADNTMTTETPAATSASTSASTTPRVFFAEPSDGATVQSPVHVRLGMEHYMLMAVPAGTPESAREGMAHQHVGVDTECLPVGVAIPKANPWIHMGDGSTEMDLQLPPGDHKLTVQAGDDLHVTLPDMCSTITVHVTE
jgi:Domain of unknown function (DUF4399)